MYIVKLHNVVCVLNFDAVPYCASIFAFAKKFQAPVGSLFALNTIRQLQGKPLIVKRNMPRIIMNCVHM